MAKAKSNGAVTKSVNPGMQGPAAPTSGQDKPLYRKGRDRIKDTLLASDPTRDYHSASYPFWGELFVQQLPPFRVWVGRAMKQSDPTVNFTLDIRSAIMQPAEFLIECDDPQLEQWLRDQIDYLWHNHRDIVLKAKEMGWLAAQPLFKTDDKGWLCVKDFKSFAWEDCRALESGGRTVGFQVKGTKLYFPQACWITYKSEFGNPYGVGCLRGAYPPWFEKWMNHGAKALQRQRMIKDAYRGDIFWYPPNQAITLPNGQRISIRDLMREMAEAVVSGSAMTFPMMTDAKGNKLTDYTPPQNINGASQVFEWMDQLNRDIMMGGGVPIETVEAPETGSGYSGRSIPMLVLMGVANQELIETIKCIDHFLLRPLAWLNTGKDPDYKIRPRSLVESFSDDVQGSAMGGAALGGPASAGRPVQVQGGAPGQFSEQFGEFEIFHTGSQWTKRRPIRTLKNPTPARLEQFAKAKGEVRGVHNQSTGDSHYWDANDAVHSEMIQGMGLEGVQHHRTYFQHKDIAEHLKEVKHKLSHLEIAHQHAEYQLLDPTEHGFMSGRKFPVHINASLDRAKALLKNSKHGELRGIRTAAGKTFLWDAHHANHDHVAQMTGHDFHNDVIAKGERIHVKSEGGLEGTWPRFTGQHQHSEGELNQQHLTKFQEELKHKHGLQDLWLFHNPNQRAIKLDSIRVSKEHRGRGVGSAAMKDITDFADKHNHRIVLTTGSKDDHHGTTSTSRLKRFYGRFGFKKNRDSSLTGNLLRHPAKAKQFGEKHSYSCLLFKLPEDLQAQVIKLGKQIPTSDLAEDGRETDPHVTLLFGLHTNDADEAYDCLVGKSPIAIQLGKTSIFSSDEHDVVKIEVESEMLHALNKEVRKELEHTQTHPTYQPHITIAYVKPGLGQYWADKLQNLKGTVLALDTVVFSNKGREHTPIKLVGPAQFAELKHWNYGNEEDAKEHYAKSGYASRYPNAKFELVPKKHISLVIKFDNHDPKGGPKYVKSIANHIKKGGKLPPAIGYRKGGQVHLMDGHHRVGAAKGHTHIPIMVADLDSQHSEDKDKLNRIIAKANARKEARKQRLEEAIKKVGDAHTVHLVRKNDDQGRQIIIHRSTREPGRWQLSQLHHDGPWGHHTFDTKHEALASAVGAHPNGPYHDHGDEDYEIHRVAQHGEEHYSELPHPLDLTVHNVKPVWEHFKKEYEAAHPSHAGGGELAAARILNSVAHHAHEFTKQIDERVKAGGHVSDDEDERYMRAPKVRKELHHHLAKLSGYRPYQHVDEHPFAQRHYYDKPYTGQHSENIGGIPLSGMTFHSEQYDETQALKQLRDFLSKGAAARIRLATEGWHRFKTPGNAIFGLEGITEQLQREIHALNQPLAEALTVAGYTSYLEGVGTVLKQIPPKVLAKSSRVTYPGVQPYTPLTALQDVLGAKVVSAVQYPPLDAAVAALQAMAWYQGHDYRQTAEYVKQGAFAITATLSDKGVETVKNTLQVALREGWGAAEYVDKVSESLAGESAPLSESHLELIFRNNIHALHSDGQYKAVQAPLVKSYLPYAAIVSTEDARRRKEHGALEKLGLDETNIYNFDDPVFKKYRSPWAYGCRCHWHPVSVEQAAKAGVKEAQEWWNKALTLSSQNKTTPYEQLEGSRPATFTFVEDPGFPIDPEFERRT